MFYVNYVVIYDFGDVNSFVDIKVIHLDILSYIGQTVIYIIHVTTKKDNCIVCIANSD